MDYLIVAILASLFGLAVGILYQKFIGGAMVYVPDNAPRLKQDTPVTHQDS